MSTYLTGWDSCRACWFSTVLSKKSCVSFLNSSVSSTMSKWVSIAGLLTLIQWAWDSHNWYKSHAVTPLMLSLMVTFAFATTKVFSPPKFRWGKAYRHFHGLSAKAPLSTCLTQKCDFKTLKESNSPKIRFVPWSLPATTYFECNTGFYRQKLSYAMSSSTQTWRKWKPELRALTTCSSMWLTPGSKSRPENPGTRSFHWMHNLSEQQHQGKHPRKIACLHT